MPTSQEIAQEVSTLFSFPEAAIRINKLVDDPNSSNEEIAKIILHDPGLTGRVLRLVNSPLYRLSKKIETVSHAITLIGRQELRNLVMATAVTQSFNKIPPQVVDMTAFWKNSVTCGTIARLLGQARQVVLCERLFIAGLLHGVGKLVFYSEYPDHYRLVLEHRANGEEAIVAAEREVFGFDHAELGAALLGAWHFPDTLCSMIANYLEPVRATQLEVETCVVHAASRIAQRVDPSLRNEASVQASPLPCDEMVREVLKIDDALVEQLIEDAGKQAIELG